MSRVTAGPVQPVADRRSCLPRRPGSRGRSRDPAPASIAALLNASDPTINYGVKPDGVIKLDDNAIDSGKRVRARKFVADAHDPT
jgi:hypothetical protein